MITRNAIRALLDAGVIRVTPDPVKIGPNSIDLRLGGTLKMYHPTEGRITVQDPVSGALFSAIDPKNPPPLIDVPKTKPWNQKGEEGWLLVPGQFYLGCTLEETYCRGVVPHLDGRSTCGRLSIEAHKTAGVGDNGYRGRWTLEIEATEPVLVAPGDRLFQIYFVPAWGAGLAHLIRSMIPEPPREGPFVPSQTYARVNPQDPQYVDWVECGEVWRTDPLFEVDDLYGTDGGGHHYQGTEGARVAPLD